MSHSFIIVHISCAANRVLWLNDVHYTAGVHAAMLSFTGLYAEMQMTHGDVGYSRSRRDFRDTQKLVEWLEVNSPFHFTVGCLHSLSTGLIASGSDDISCDVVEDVGRYEDGWQSIL